MEIKRVFPQPVVHIFCIGARGSGGNIDVQYQQRCVEQNQSAYRIYCRIKTRYERENEVIKIRVGHQCECLSVMISMLSEMVGSNEIIPYVNARIYRLT